MFINLTTSAAQRRPMRLPRALEKEFSFAVQLVSPAQAGTRAGAFRGSRSTCRSPV